MRGTAGLWSCCIAVCGCSDLLDADDYRIARPPDPVANACPEGAIPRGTGCLPVGVADCGLFERDDRGGCTTHLPATCSGAKMAFPGKIECHDIAAVTCQPGFDPDPGSYALVADLYVWPDAPGSEEDGSRGNPFRTIAAAIEAAAPGDTVMLAPATYPETVVIDRPITLRGACMGDVVIAGASTGASLIVQADGSRLRQLVVTGDGIGISARGSDVTIEESWVHTTGGHGIELAATQPDAMPQAHIDDTLVDGARGAGIHAEGYALTLRRINVRNTTADPDRLELGDGIAVFPGRYLRGDQPPESAVLTVEHTLVERNGGAGIRIEGSHADIADTVVRDMQLSTDAELLGLPPAGHGVVVATEQSRALGVEASASLRRCVVSGAWGAALRVVNAQATVQNTVLDATRASGGGACAGNGLRVIADATKGGEVHLSHSLIQSSAGSGVLILGGHATLTESIVRNSAPSPCGQAWGDAASVMSHPQRLAQGDQPSTLQLTRSLLHASTRGGVVLFDAVANLDEAVIEEVPQPVVGAHYAPSDGQISFDPTLQSRRSLCGPKSALTPCQAVIVAELDPPLFSRLDDGSRGPVVPVGGNIQTLGAESLAGAVAWIYGHDEIPVAVTTNSAGDWLLPHVPAEKQLFIGNHADEHFVDVRAMRTHSFSFSYNAALVPVQLASELLGAMLGEPFDVTGPVVHADMPIWGLGLDAPEARLIAHLQATLVAQEDADGSATQLFAVGLPSATAELRFFELDSNAPTTCTGARVSFDQGVDTSDGIRLPLLRASINTIQPICR